MVKPTFHSAFVQHLLTLIKERLSSHDANLASKLVDSAKDACAAANFLASALFIYKIGQIPHLPRQLLFSKTFSETPVSAEDRPQLDRLLDELRTGGAALERARSRLARRALQHRRDGSPFIFLDRCFLNWGVHHFHVHPTDGKRDLLLYAAFDDHFAYLLALSGHTALNDQNLVSAMSEVCPHLLTTVKGIAGDALPNEAVNNLRAKNAAFATPSDHGAVIPRILCSAGGTSFHAGRDVDREFAWLEALQRALDDPSSEHYCALQLALGTSEALRLSVVPDESNFCGSVLVRDDKSDRLIRLDYGDKTQAFHASWQ
jgi:hypothetical protein